MKLKNIESKYVLVGIALLALILLRIPSLFEPHWNEFEGELATASHMLQQGNALYTDIPADKLPLVYFLFRIAAFSNNYSLLIIKIFGLGASILSTFFVYKISESLFKHRVLQLIPTFITAILLGVPITQANVSHLELFILPLSLFSVFLLLHNKNLTAKSGIAIGLVTGCIALWDISAVSIPIAFGIYVLFIQQKHKKTAARVHAAFIGGTILPVFLALLYLLVSGSFDAAMDMIFKTPLAQISEAAGNAPQLIIIGNTLFARSLLFLLAVGTTTYLYKKSAFSRHKALLILWTLALVYSAAFYQQKSVHVLIPLIPAVSFVFAEMVAARMRGKMPANVYTQKILQLTAAAYIFLVIITGGVAFQETYGLRSYYANFYNYLVGKKDTTSYTTYFGDDVYSAYKLNSYLAQNHDLERNVAVLTNNLWIYPIADLAPVANFVQRNITASNMEVLLEADNSPSICIVDTRTHLSKDYKNILIQKGYILEGTVDNYQIFIVNASQ